MSTRQATRQQRQNGAAANANAQAPDEAARVALAEAIAYEEQIRAEADRIRAGKTVLDRALFLQLLPLLRKPIPAGFIQHVDAVSGKPYDSDGVSSVQVQIERMDAVLTPFGWWDETEWLASDGTLAEVTVHVGDAEDRTSFFSRKARGGVKQPQPGNTAKGTYTNAAKLAFARVGPAHEVYLGAADFDPDTNREAAQAQAEGGERPAAEAKLDAERVQKLQEAITAAGLDDDWRDLKLRGFGVAALADLSYEQGLSLFSQVTDIAKEQPNG